MKEVEVDGATYQIGKLTVMEQWHVSRRLLDGLTKIEAGSQVPAGILVLAKLNDKDSEFVINTCLSVVRRKSGEVWARLTSKEGGMMFPIEMGTMLKLTFEVINENVVDFFSSGAAQPTSPAQPPAPASHS